MEKLRLGGMALQNGVLVHGPRTWGAAVRLPDGTIKTASGPKPRLGLGDSVPVVRGAMRLAEAFAVLPAMKRGLPEAPSSARPSRSRSWPRPRAPVSFAARRFPSCRARRPW